MVALVQGPDIAGLYRFPDCGLWDMSPGCPPPVWPAGDDEPSENPTVSHATGSGYRPIPINVARAWSEAW
jgi:hypothetical protein